MAAEYFGRSFGLAAALGKVDGLGIGFHRVVVALAHLVEDVAHLVHPAALVSHARIDGLNGGRQSGAAIGDDQL